MWKKTWGFVMARKQLPLVGPVRWICIRMRETGEWRIIGRTEIHHREEIRGWNRPRTIRVSYSYETFARYEIAKRAKASPFVAELRIVEGDTESQVKSRLQGEQA